MAGNRILLFYPVIYGLSDEDDWNDEKNWYKANPSLGYTISIDRVRDAYREALDNPAEENVFKQLRLNIWTNSAVAWIPEHIYDREIRRLIILPFWAGTAMPDLTFLLPQILQRWC